MIIIKANILINPEELDYYYKKILEQKNEGVILLPAFCDVITMSGDDETDLVVRDMAGREYRIK